MTSFREIPALSRPSTIASTTLLWVEKYLPPAAEILIPILSPGFTSDRHALAMSPELVVAMTTSSTMRRTACGFSLKSVIADSSAMHQTTDLGGGGEGDGEASGVAAKATQPEKNRINMGIRGRTTGANIPASCTVCQPSLC